MKPIGLLTPCTPSLSNSHGGSASPAKFLKMLGPRQQQQQQQQQELPAAASSGIMSGAGDPGFCLQHFVASLSLGQCQYSTTLGCLYGSVVVDLES